MNDSTDTEIKTNYITVQDVVADFSADKILGYPPLQVQFTDLSSSPDSIDIWAWDFENDGTIDSYEQNPSYTYSDTGSYSVSLTVTDVNDSTDTEVKTNYISVQDVVADFSADNVIGYLPLQVQFTDLSSSPDSIDTWAWDFDNDGTIDSYEQNPSYTYPDTGSYTVSLTVIDVNDSTDIEIKTNYITVQGIVAEFSADKTLGYSPLDVQFTDLSSSTYSIDTCEWDFDNDGIIDSYEQNPAYTYADTGSYSVSLTITDISDSTDTEIKTNYIIVQDVVADFSADNVIGSSPLEINFTDLSSSPDSIDSWEWDFDNDGTIDSYEQNPSYTYADTGSYSVSLKVFDVNDSTDTETKLDYIYIQPNHSGPKYFVDTTGSDNNNGSQEYPFATIQHALNSVSENDTIMVAAGIYFENIEWPDTDGIKLIGSGMENCIIDAGQNGRVIKFYNVTVTSSTLMSGFTIQNGYNPNSGGGAGIYCYNTSPTFENLIIANNTFSDHGAFGGGVSCMNSNLSFENVIIAHNSILGDEIDFYVGGGIYCKNSNIIMQNCTISNNLISAGSYSFGSGITSENSDITIINSIIADNQGDYAINAYNSNSSITYSNFFNNEPGNFSGVNDSIGVNVTTNSRGDSCDAFYNIQLDPLFVDAANGDYHLTTYSPCINTGDPDSPYDPDSTICDMGAFYYHQNEPLAVFEVQPTSGFEPLTVNFTDQSLGIITDWKWDFENDGIIDSYEQNPEFTYSVGGTYSPKLIIENSSTQQIDSLSKENHIIVLGNPAAPADVEVTIDKDDAIVTWTEVDTTIYGQSVTVDCYLVYYGSSADSLFGFHGYTTNTAYTHSGVVQFSDVMFYKVTAYVGDMPALKSVLAKHKNIKLGQLKKLLINEGR